MAKASTAATLSVSTFCARVNHSVTQTDSGTRAREQGAEVVEPHEVDGGAERVGDDEGLDQRAHCRNEEETAAAPGAARSRRGRTQARVAIVGALQPRGAARDRPRAACRRPGGRRQFCRNASTCLHCSFSNCRRISLPRRTASSRPSCGVFLLAHTAPAPGAARGGLRCSCRNEALRVGRRRAAVELEDGDLARRVGRGSSPPSWPLRRPCW